jgi:tetratricopeptide (TPR) repeat protein
LLAPGAHARDEAPRNPELAEKLFAQGKLALEAGRRAEACEAFSASQAAEPSVGALLNLARCDEDDGRIATAWATYRAAATLAGQRGEEERRRGALELVARLEPRLSRLSLEISPQHAPVVVELDGQVLPSVSLGVAVPVDPGNHLVVTRAAGHEVWRSTVVVQGEGTRTLVLVPPLREATSASPAASSTASEERGPAGTKRGTAQRAVGLVLAGVGLGALAGGAVEGGRALALDATLERLCGQPGAGGARPCPATLTVTIDSAEVAGNTATVLLAAGGALLVTGTTLFVTALGADAPRKAQALEIAPLLSPSFAGLGVCGVF